VASCTSFIESPTTDGEGLTASGKLVACPFTALPRSAPIDFSLVFSCEDVSPLQFDTFGFGGGVLVAGAGAGNKALVRTERTLAWSSRRIGRIASLSHGFVTSAALELSFVWANMGLHVPHWERRLLSISRGATRPSLPLMRQKYKRELDRGAGTSPLTVGC